MAFILIVIVVAALDQVVKGIIVDKFMLYEAIEVVPDLFNLTYIANQGSPFSILTDIETPWHHYFSLVIGAFALVLLTIYWVWHKDSNGFLSVVLGVIGGGVLGNFIDRVRYGAVVDFLDFYYKKYHWPAFNIADIAICLGVSVFVILTIFPKNQQKIDKR